jgi:acetyltransferase-like isoleucine patch superfamily enzyme
LNPHNKTIPVSYFKPGKVFIGKETYGPLDITDFGLGNEKLLIGSYCSISNGVQFLLCGEHPTNTISTYPFKFNRFSHKQEAFSKGDIVIGDDVWIGTNAIICSGVKIGQGAIIAARAIVVKDVEPYSIAGGNPARLIRYRFGETIRKKLLSVNIVELFDSFTKDKIDLIYADLTLDNIECILNYDKYSR